jgi:predicted aspartyl protease
MRQVRLIIEPEPDDPGCATVMVDGTIAGRPYRFILDTGSPRTQLAADDYTTALDTVAEFSSSGTFGDRVTYPVVTVADIAVGPLRAATLPVIRAERGGSRLSNLIGMDLLQRFCCHFRLDAGVLDLDPPPGWRGEHDLLLDSRGHIYVDVHWPGVTARATWDTGAGATIVNRDFWLGHPELFQEIGMSTGTDATGTQAETPLLMMAQATIGGRTFGRHPAVAVDLSRANSGIEYPMDLILGYPTLRQADWVFDFPARRWGLAN